jgi:hypothetical protein
MTTLNCFNSDQSIEIVRDSIISAANYVNTT